MEVVTGNHLYTCDSKGSEEDGSCDQEIVTGEAASANSEGKEKEENDMQLQLDTVSSSLLDTNGTPQEGSDNEDCFSKYETKSRDDRNDVCAHKNSPKINPQSRPLSLTCKDPSKRQGNSSGGAEHNEAMEVTKSLESDNNNISRVDEVLDVGRCYRK